MKANRQITANIARLNTFMDEAGLDALVLRSGQNFTYLSGVVYPGTLQRHMDLTDSTRPVVLLWPRATLGWNPAWQPGAPVRLGQAMGQRAAA